MSKTVVISSLAVSIAGVSAFCIYKWMKNREITSRFFERYERMEEMYKNMVHGYSSLTDFPKLSNLTLENFGSFHENVANYCLEMCNRYKVQPTRILDVGCGTGSLSFWLSKHFQQVIGTDVSFNMIQSAQLLKQFSKSSASFSTEGGKHIKLVNVEVPNSDYRERVTFWDEDVCALSHTAGQFSCVVVANTLTDLYNPKEFLLEIKDYVIDGGLLIIADTYHWPDGPESVLECDGDKTTKSIIMQCLEPCWTYCQKTEIPFCFPQSNRTALIGSCDVSVWQKKIDLDFDDS